MLASPPEPTRRARTIAEMLAVLSRLRSEDSLRRALSFQPRPSDVFIATFPKCGTTWVQQIVHGLRSRGSMEFDEITEVVTWLEFAHDLNLDLEGQTYFPRAYKTHLTWEHIPKRARYIYIMRDPRDVLISLYHFFEGWIFEPGSISLDTFTREFFVPRPMSYWSHVRSWWPRLQAPDVLALCFEDLKRDLPGHVAQIAGFIGCDDADAIDVTTRQATFAFMSEHGDRFDDHLVRQARNPICGLPSGNTSKLRAGRVGDHKQVLSPELARLLEDRWHTDIERPLGLSSYDELRERVHAFGTSR